MINALGHDTDPRRSKREMKKLLCLLLIAALPGQLNANPIYGNTAADDGREDIYKVQNSVIQAKSRAVAILSHGALLKSPANGKVTYEAVTLGEASNLAKGTRFEDQKLLGFCTAFLITDTLMLTAGHCFVDDKKPEPLFEQAVKSCDNTLAIFDYVTTAEEPTGKSVLPMSDFFVCSRVVMVSHTFDFTLFEINRPAPSKRQPLAISGVDPNQIIHHSTSMIGHPDGIPMKYTSGAQFRRYSDTTNRLYTDLDAFSGNSGSPVFDDTTGKAVGILVSGTTDYNENKTTKISTMNVITPPGYLSRFLSNIFTDYYGREGVVPLALVKASLQNSSNADTRKLADLF